MLSNLPKSLQGKFFFPLHPGTKDPALKNGWRGASNDPEQLRKWAELSPNANWAVACGMSDLFVFDIDPAGIAYWENLVASDAAIRAAVADALIVQTPKGGFHVYFEGSGPSTASRIAEGIDTRGGIRRGEEIESGGYVLLPGSSTSAGKGRVEGEYRIIQDRPVKPLPACLSAIVPAKRKTEIVGEASVSLDNARNVAWASELLKSFVRDGKVSIEGAGGDDQAFRVACAVMEKGVSSGKCMELLGDLWNPHCQPPWSDEELERIVANASCYGDDTGTGAKGLLSNQDAFAAFVASYSEEEPQASDDRRGRVQWLHDYAANAKPPEWLIPNLLPSSGVGMVYGDSGSFKTFVMFDIALSLAFGIGGQWGAPPVKNDVLFLAGEDPASMALKRWPAWMEFQKIEDKTDHRCLIIDHVPPLSDGKKWSDLRDDLAALEFKPSLIVIDTLTKLMLGMDENSSKEAGVAWDFMDNLARYYGCLVLFIHHTGKDQSRGARGSILFNQNATVTLAMKRKGEEGLGTELFIKKLKDAEFNPTIPIYLKKEEVGPSLMLVKSDAPPMEDVKPSKSSRCPWASVEDITALLHTNGGSLSHSILVQEIAATYDVEPDKVRRELSKASAIQFLKVGNTWQLPEHKYDL